MKDEELRVMRKLSFFNFIIFTLAMTLAACGDFWEGGDPTPARSMTLQRKLVNLMVGDKYKIPVAFAPDSVANHGVWWQAEYEDIVTFSNDSVVGVSEGLSRVYATSVSSRLKDSCLVNVLPAAYVNPHDYCYDMVIYADVTIHGKKYTKADEDSLVIAAYVDNELRGIGKMREWQGKPYMEIRIWNPFEWGDLVDLLCIYRGKARVELFDDIFEFDGETHGTLSNLYPLVIDENSEEYYFGYTFGGNEDNSIDEENEIIVIAGDE